MSEQLADYKVDRTGWAPGPWDAEGDREQWVHAGYACLMVRHARHGYWCGYVGVDNRHPLYGEHPLHSAHPFFRELNPARELNYGEACDDGVICHVPQRHMPADVWWLGMDFGHFLDQAPGLEAREREMDELIPKLRELRDATEERRKLHPEYFPHCGGGAAGGSACSAAAPSTRTDCRERRLAAELM